MQSNVLTVEMKSQAKSPKSKLEKRKEKKQAKLILINCLLCADLRFSSSRVAFSVVLVWQKQSF